MTKTERPAPDPAAASNPVPAPAVVAPGRPVTHREYFWQNVVREMLMALSVASQHAAARPAADPTKRADHQHQTDGSCQADPPATPPAGPSKAPQAGLATQPVEAASLFDGRLAVVTASGARIPIAAVVPVFACSINGRGPQHALSLEVQCSVFHVRTPSGEAYTLPLHEIRMIHALSDELIERLREQAEVLASKEARAAGADSEPFGFAAFTSLARQAEAERVAAPDGDIGLPDA